MMALRYNDDFFGNTYLNGPHGAQQMNGPNRAQQTNGSNKARGTTNEWAEGPGPTNEFRRMDPTGPGAQQGPRNEWA